MQCPKCVAFELLPAFHPDAHGLEMAAQPHMCSHCGGLWMPSATAIGLIKSKALLQPVVIDDPAAIRARDAKVGTCPNNHGILIRITIFDNEPYTLERCAECGGMWFDGGEWERLRANPQEHRVLDWDAAEMLAVAALKEAVERDAMLAQYGEVLVKQLEWVADALRPFDDKVKALNYLRLRMAGQ